MQILSHKPEEISTLKYDTILTIRCDHCTEVFTRKAAPVQINLNRGSKFMFCSKACAVIGGAKAKLHPLICEDCGKEYLGLINKRYPHNFCDNTCRKRFQRKERQALLPPKPPKLHKVEEVITPTKTTFNIHSIALNIDEIPVEGKMFDCSGCGTPVLRFKKNARQCKTGRFYCSKGCRMRHYNANILTRSSNQRSKAEDRIAELIQRDFPDVVISLNDRSLLSNGLEIDIYVPSARLAIELNGPVHYLPIYGEEKLRTTQYKDAAKHLEIHEKGLSLMVLDISRLHSKKQQETFLLKHYTEDIKPLLMGAVAALDALTRVSATAV